MGRIPNACSLEHAINPSSKELNAQVENILDSGIGNILIVALVIIPNTPSVPMNKWLKFGPEEYFGTYFVVINFPDGRTASMEITCSPIDPYDPAL